MVEGRAVAGGVASMRYEPSSEVRHAAAMRLMQRVEAITKQALVKEIVPAPGDIKSSLADRHLIDELEGLRLAQSGPLKRSTDGYFRYRGDSSGMTHYTTVQRLIDKGLMEYGNSCRSFVMLTEEGKRGA
jgi:hypothetical protein